MKFNIDLNLMVAFYKDFIEFIWTFSLICWFGTFKIKQENSLSKILITCSKVP